MLHRFDIEALDVVKFNLSGPQVQGTPADRDIHGPPFSNLLTDLEV